ncbi:MAG: aminotransferase class I/II-fold pyridoxal phosphate-dependent enzyme [Pirellulaceae bacterium]|nr:aminotransferase class I/II-fold pyridoxal phosphate-dependent enzyme [Pirellulaceae bacterium]
MGQARIYLSPPHMSGREQSLIANVFASNWVAPVGPDLAEFERQFAAKVGVSSAAAVSSGTAALHLALHALKLKPEDEVICSTFTFCASANPITYEGAKPVFIDSDRTSWNLDPNLLSDEIQECADRGKLPKAVLAVDILGQSADMDAIREVVDRYEIPVIEDAAEALGATYKDRPAGASGWASAFSFNGNKIITTSGGGMLCSNDDQLIERAKFWATQAKDAGHLYQHSEIGFNYRLSNVLAAVGLAQLDVLDERVATRRKNFQFYADRLGDLPGVTFMPEADFGHSNRWLTVARIDSLKFGVDCEAIRRKLEEHNIESRRVWIPLHKQVAFSNCRCRGGEVAEEIFSDSLCLPSGTALTRSDLDRICSLIEEIQSVNR